MTINVAQFSKADPQDIASALDSAKSLFKASQLYISFVGPNACSQYCKPAAGICDQHLDLASVRGCPSRTTDDWDQEVAWAAQYSATPSDIWILLLDMGKAVGGCRYNFGPIATVDTGHLKVYNLLIAHELGHIFGLSDENLYATTFMYSKAQKPVITTTQRQTMVGTFPALAWK